MARTKREQSTTGIYHVMLRGINKQNIFFCEEDCIRMMQIIRDAQYLKASDGTVQSSNLCTIYAYCILDNHVHILIREGERTISDIMRRIADSYAVAYNKKYDRVGHLFQGRFPSEPVNNQQYFYTLIRYIHRNPVKALEASNPEEYPYSSWNEYTNHKSNIVKVLKPEAIQSVLNHYTLENLTQWVGQDVDDNCMDMDTLGFVLSDKEAAETILELSGMNSIEEFRQLDPATQIYYLLQSTDHHVTLRQTSRIGTLSYYMMQKAAEKKRGANPIKGSDPLIGENVEQKCDVEGIQEKVRRMTGVGKKTKHNLHQIVEYLLIHNEAKCKEIAEYVGLSSERTRINLLKLSNVNIVEVRGSNKAITYSIKNVEQINQGV